MSLNPFSFFVGIIFALIIIVLETLLLKKNKNYDISFMIFVTIVTIMRLIIPMEFDFTHTFYFEDPLIPIEYFLTKQYIWRNFSFSVGQILIVIWGIGILFFGTIFTMKLCKLNRMKKVALRYDEQVIDRILKRVEITDFPLTKISFYSLPPNLSPFSTGLIKKNIFIPKIGYTENELYYVIMHEITHFCKYDLWIKFLVKILCISFWWNPLVWYFKKKLFKLLEFRIDQQVINTLSCEQVIEYVKCLMKCAHMKSLNIVDIQSNFSCLNESVLYKRCSELLVPHVKQNKRTIQKYFLFCIGILLSYSIIFQTTHSTISQESYIEGLLELPGIDTEVFEKENIHIVPSQGDSYELYIDEKIQGIFTVDSEIGIP